jgi:hypothetical protein
MPFSNVVPIRGHQENRFLATCEELTREAQSGAGLGLLYIMDRGDQEPLIGVSGSFRGDPSSALQQARKLVSILTMMQDAKMLRSLP